MNTQLPQRPLFTLPIYSLNLHDPIQQVQNTENIVQDPKKKKKAATTKEKSKLRLGFRNIVKEEKYN